MRLNSLIEKSPPGIAVSALHFEALLPVSAFYMHRTFIAFPLTPNDILFNILFS
jgi:hypothetical protein